MEAILPALQQYETAIYILLGFVALVHLQKVLVAWDQAHGMIYGIERELALRRFQSGLTILILVGLLAGAEFLIVTFVLPAAPQRSALATPTLDVLATPTVTLPPPLQGAAQVQAQEVTPSPTPTEEPVPEGCVAGKVEWVTPANDEVIVGTVKLTGTVNVPNLGFYKYEYAAVGSDIWTTIAANAEPKVNGEIGFWNTTQLEIGEYWLRLVVVDNQEQSFPICMVKVRIAKP